MLHEIPALIQKNNLKRRQEKLNKEIESPIRNYKQRKHKKY
jgi:hypothetical protein